MVVAMLKFASIWHRSTLYIWYLCPSLSLLSHGSTLYSSIHGCLFLSWICLVLVYSHDEVTSIHESKYWCIADACSMTPSDQVGSYLKVITCSIKALTYHIPLASCFRGHSITLKICHQHVIGSLTQTFSLKSQTSRESYSRCWFQHTKLQHRFCPQPDKRYLVQHRTCCVKTKQFHRL